MQYNSGPDANSGKENLLFKDHGKHVYSLIDRRTRKSIRT
ncbi:FmdE family protein [Methanothermobacter tenebrarum]